jgi:hypothetical protein
MHGKLQRNLLVSPHYFFLFPKKKKKIQFFAILYTKNLSLMVEEYYRLDVFDIMLFASTLACPSSIEQSETIVMERHSVVSLLQWNPFWKG